MAKKGGKGKGTSRLDLLADVVFSQSYGDVGRELLAAISNALQQGVPANALALPLHQAIMYITEGIIGGGPAGRQEGLVAAQERLSTDASRSTGPQKVILQILSGFVASNRGTLASRLHELQKLLHHLLGTEESDAAAKAPKRKRDEDEEDDPAAVKGPSRGAGKESAKRQLKAAESKGEVKGRASRQSTRVKTKALQLEVGDFLITLIRAATLPEFLPEELRDTASSGSLNMADLF